MAGWLLLDARQVGWLLFNGKLAVHWWQVGYFSSEESHKHPLPFFIAVVFSFAAIFSQFHELALLVLSQGHPPALH